MMTRRNFIVLAIGFAAGLMHGCGNDDDSEGGLWATTAM